MRHAWGKCIFLKTKHILKEFSQVLFFPQWASLWAKPAFVLCGAPYSTAVIPHFHVRGRENIIFVVITLRANQTDHFSISDGYMTANRKLGFLQLGWIYAVFVYIAQNDIYSFLLKRLTYVDGCSVGGSLFSSMLQMVCSLSAYRSSTVQNKVSV